MRLYDDLVPWYRLLDPYEDHEEEADVFTAAFERAVEGGAQTLLELGSGAGNNVVHMARRFTCTLADLSERMLALSRELNPGCEHVLGDMRTLRLHRTFDAVLVHDAIVYMRTEADLRAAMETAYVHTRPGGAALFTPDCVTETFEEKTELHESEEGRRAMRCIEWDWDPDPTDTTFMSEFAFLLREGTMVHAVHDRHVVGLFPRATWVALLQDVGFAVEAISRPIGEGKTDEVFLCRKPR